MKFVQYDFLDNYSVTVINDTVAFYQHLRFDQHAQFLSDVAKKVALELIPEEIGRLKQFDSLMERLNQAFDLPEKELGLIANLLMNGNGKISHKKKKGALQHVHNDDLDQAERIYDALFNDDNDNAPND
jgi:hypothetical protein